MMWQDHTIKTDEPAEVTEMPDGRIELSWGSRDGSRLTIELERAEFAGILDKGRALMAQAVAV